MDVENYSKRLSGKDPSFDCNYASDGALFEALVPHGRDYTINQPADQQQCVTLFRLLVIYWLSSYTENGCKLNTYTPFFLSGLELFVELMYNSPICETSNCNFPCMKAD